MSKLQDYLDRRKQKKRVCDYCGNKENYHGKVMYSVAFSKPKLYWHEVCFSIYLNQSTPNFAKSKIKEEE